MLVLLCIKVGKAIYFRIFFLLYFLTAHEGGLSGSDFFSWILVVGLLVLPTLLTPALSPGAKCVSVRECV